MVIKVSNTGIQFNNYNLIYTSDGFEFDGKIIANNFIPSKGTIVGYTSGGAYSNVIDKFPFATDANATDVGDLTSARRNPTGNSSSLYGYSSGGFLSGRITSIDRFPFSVDTGSAVVGSLGPSFTDTERAVGQSSSDNGYISGGLGTPSPKTAITKFPFAVSSVTVSSVGSLTQGRYFASGQSSSTHGYTAGGAIPFPASYSNVIDKFPFAADANATDVGDLTQNRLELTGQSSSTHGYATGGISFPSVANIIDTFPFASDTNATEVGNLSVDRRKAAGQSSSISGYTSAGTVGPSNSNVIDKFPFANNGTATDVGDLTQGRYGPAGHQV